MVQQAGSRPAPNLVVPQPWLGGDQLHKVQCPPLPESHGEEISHAAWIAMLILKPVIPP